jgi:hypothetical protein
MSRALLWSASLVIACTDPTAPPIPAGVRGVEVTAATIAPPETDGSTGPAFRITFTLSAPTRADAARKGRLLIVRGEVDDADVVALAKSRPSAALKQRIVEVTSWGTPAPAPTALHAQPTLPLDPGRATAIVLLADRAPVVHGFDVGGGPIVRRIWPIGARPVTSSMIFCGTALAERRIEGRTIDLAPSERTATLRPLGDLPCFVVEAPPDLRGVILPPPEIDGIAIEPGPIAIGSPAPLVDEPACPEASSALLGDPAILCARVEDDRIVLVGGVSDRAILGTIGPRLAIASLHAGARAVVRGLPPATTLPIDLRVETLRGTRKVTGSITTAPARRRFVVNEVLARPPSGVAAQRFVEIVNDGDEEADLAGLSLVDGNVEHDLPALRVPAGGFVLVTPYAFVDGLAGDPAPPAGTARVTVEALQLSSEVALIEGPERVLSRFPKTTSTRKVSRGRRAPDRPDDAPDAFGWDLAGSATPGRRNEIAP